MISPLSQSASQRRRAKSLIYAISVFALFVYAASSRAATSLDSLHRPIRETPDVRKLLRPPGAHSTDEKLKLAKYLDVSHLPVDSDGTTIVARVNSGRITLPEFELGMEWASSANAQKLNPVENSVVRTVIAQNVLDDLIREELLREYAAKNGITVSDAQVDDAIAAQNRFLPAGQKLQDLALRRGQPMAELRERLRKQVLLARVHDHIGRMAMPASGQTLIDSQKQLHAEHLKYRQPETTAPEVRVRHLVIRCPADSPTTEVEVAKKIAEHIRKEIADGRDFADAVHRYSQDKNTREIGGDIGFIKQGQTYPAFEQAAFALKPGELSAVVQTPVGFHILQVTDRRNDDLQSAYLRAERERLFDEYLQTAKKEAKIVNYLPHD